MAERFEHLEVIRVSQSELFDEAKICDLKASLA